MSYLLLVGLIIIIFGLLAAQGMHNCGDKSYLSLGVFCFLVFIAVACILLMFGGSALAGA